MCYDDSNVSYFVVHRFTHHCITHHDHTCWNALSIQVDFDVAQYKSMVRAHLMTPYSRASFRSWPLLCFTFLDAGSRHLGPCSDRTKQGHERGRRETETET